MPAPDRKKPSYFRNFLPLTKTEETKLDETKFIRLKLPFRPEQFFQSSWVILTGNNFLNRNYNFFKSTNKKPGIAGEKTEFAGKRQNLLAKKFLSKKITGQKNAGKKIVAQKIIRKNYRQKNAGTFSRTERIPAQCFNFEEMGFLKNQAVSRIGSSFGSRST